jgi:GLPGLI family protein
MKKQFLLFSVLLLAAGIAQAQKPDTASTMVHYKFTHLRDTTKPQDRYEENMILLIGKNATAYKSYDRQLAEASMRKQVADQMAANGGNGPIRINSGKRSGSSNEYYLFPAENKLVRKEKLINNYIIEEPLPIQDWQISSDTATLSGLHCQKATTHFKGRDYTAWFSPDIPSHSGPWKLTGLPGLIIEAYDTKKEVVFKFDGMEDISKTAKPVPTEMQGQPGPVTVKLIGIEEADADPRLIKLPADGIKTTQKEFLTLRDAMRKDPNAFAQAAMAGSGGGNFGGNGPKANINIRIVPTVENNPIELPEKK